MIETLAAMDPLTIAAFMGASVLLYLTPGIDMMFTLGSGLAGGRRAGLAAGLGVSFGTFFHTGIAVLGVSALIRDSQTAYTVLRLAGAGYLLWLAVAFWRAPVGASAKMKTARPARAFFRGALGNMLNPKVSIFILAFLPQFTDPAAGPLWRQVAILGLLFSLGSVPFLAAFGLFAGALSHRIAHRARVLNRVAAIIFGGLAARLILE